MLSHFRNTVGKEGVGCASGPSENKESGTVFRSDCGLTVINVSVFYSKIFTANCVSALS